MCREGGVYVQNTLAAPRLLLEQCPVCSRLGPPSCIWNEARLRRNHLTLPRVLTACGRTSEGGTTCVTRRLPTPTSALELFDGSSPRLPLWLPRNGVPNRTIPGYFRLTEQGQVGDKVPLQRPEGREAELWWCVDGAWCETPEWDGPHDTAPEESCPRG